jgi:hypothetical protein
VSSRITLLSTVFSQAIECCFLSVEFDLLTGASIVLIIPGIIIALIGADILDPDYTPLQLESLLGSPLAVSTTVIGLILLILGMYGCDVGRRKDAANDVALIGRVAAGAVVAAWYTLLLKTLLELFNYGALHGYDQLGVYTAFVVTVVLLIIFMAVLKVAIVSGYFSLFTLIYVDILTNRTLYLLQWL